MKIPFRHLAVAAALIAAQCYAGAASAQWLDAVKGQMESQGSSTQSGTTQGGILQGLGNSLPLSSLTPASAGNAAGVLEFCMKNNYLAGGDAQALKEKLMGKIGGGSTQKAKSDSGYLAGLQGLLNGSDGKSVDLSGGGLKEELTRKACDQVLKHAKSFL
ncbi:DUF2501 domain-containing protein [Achromobacter sp. ACRQX]|uniref:DUF2501 domain-containing protein n=1 Tax=Achromobacter sp. ACRQX TaxID=2918181 RepID=UPI001EF1E348|nr:DUF2501 domain-containing protein [Achromobacter sp. ACRQX]MCG7327647.1 DUF2501 domain-containing protein [Achromobacter sp. ACRQX]